MPALRDLLSTIPGLPAGPRTFAAHPVWAGSTTAEVCFTPTPKKAAVKLWHRLRDFDRRTHERGQHGGAIGPAALAVAHALIFDFLNYATGRLDPSYASIARAANLCERTVATALAKLRELRVLHWIRRCSVATDGTRRQETNAYAVLPDTQWRGYRHPPQAPAPAQGTWGDPPPVPTAIELAVLVRRESGPEEALAALRTDPDNKVAAALASLQRTMLAAQSV